ncbi:MAG: HAD family phosphatase [Anaerolineae bacterium]|nr:HAD family phosphatase [Anaerolineae bacterium]
MPIKLIVSDLDGTLVDANLTISLRLRQAIDRARRAGVTVTIATGRGYPTTRRFAAQLGIDAPLICYQGAEIVLPDGTLLYRRAMPREHLRTAIALCESAGWEISVYHDDQIYVATMQRDQAFYDRWFSLPVHQVADLMAALPSDPIKFIIAAADQDQADQIEHALRTRAAGQFQVMRSHAWFVEGLAAEVSKGNAVAQLARRMGLHRDEVMALGDSGNDRSMVEWAGIGVAMGNASPDVKAAADVIAPPQEMDGAAWAIERYIERVHT